MNKGTRITFKSFIHEIFNGFFNFDATFWRTLIPLLTSPGKVSRDYIDGKRQRYTNPFRFYLAVSIIFFLLIGLSMTKAKYEELSKGSSTEIIDLDIDDEKNTDEELSKKELDSIKKNFSDKMDKVMIPIPENTKKEILNEIEKNNKKPKNEAPISVNLNGIEKLEKINLFLKKYPDIKMDAALDSLQLEKNFTNRFLYTRAETLLKISKNKDSQRQFVSQLLSYGSIALFIMLPFFTLFLKFFYIRRRFTYVDHLIFVFHSQTVFFMIFSIVFILKILNFQPQVWIFLVLFLIYLLIAMKKFYQQSNSKTFLKFLLVNLSFSVVASIGMVILSIVSFALA